MTEEQWLNSTDPQANDEPPAGPRGRPPTASSVCWPSVAGGSSRERGSGPWQRLHRVVENCRVVRRRHTACVSPRGATPLTFGCFPFPSRPQELTWGQRDTCISVTALPRSFIADPRQNNARIRRRPRPQERSRFSHGGWVRDARGIEAISLVLDLQAGRFSVLTRVSAPGPAGWDHTDDRA